MSVPQRTPSDRRTFIRRLGIAALGSSTLPLAACQPAERAHDAGNAADADARTGPAGSLGADHVISRPVLFPWSEDIVRIAAPSPELPVAYVSMTLRRVFVDHDFRDRASWLLDAHISVSTGHWRIRLPGDPPEKPIAPGDVLREFEEFAIHDWDASMPPAVDDIRIRRGRRVTRRVDFECVPLARGGSPKRWYGAGPWDITVCDGMPGDTTREDFMVVGTGLRYLDRACARGGEAVQYVTWAVRGV